MFFDQLRITIWVVEQIEKKRLVTISKDGVALDRGFTVCRNINENYDSVWEEVFLLRADGHHPARLITSIIREALKVSKEREKLLSEEKYREGLADTAAALGLK